MDFPLILPRLTMLLSDPFGKPHPLMATGQLQLATWKLSDIDGISSKALQLLAAGWSRGTNSTYECAWRRWDSWCSERQVDPISCAIQLFLEFLTGLFREGLQYHTINTIPWRGICPSEQNTFLGWTMLW